jgi:hypothetical protein
MICLMYFTHSHLPDSSLWAGWCSSNAQYLLVERWTTQISAGTEVFHGFLQSFQANTQIVPFESHDCFLPHPVHFIFHQSSHHWCCVVWNISAFFLCKYNIRLHSGNSIWMKCSISMGHWWNDTDRGKPKYLEINISQCHLICYISHADLPGSNPDVCELTAWAMAWSPEIMTVVK